jgi:hypothetical protein
MLDAVWANDGINARPARQHAMKIYSCPVCGQDLYFGNLTCTCGAVVAMDPHGAGFLTGSAHCANRAEIGCNWAATAPGGLCRSCVMTEVIPDTFHGENRALWSEAERAKRWVLATLARWGMFTDADPGPRPVFHLLAEGTGAGHVHVSMGHHRGVVTINVTEANPVERAQRREGLGELLRTMIGHFRHELAHFSFQQLVGRDGFLDRFREVFGDERADYGEALALHYRDGPPAGWQARHVTPYAACHPSEDWAESVAHLLHLTDIIDSFVAAGLYASELPAPDYDAYAETDPDRLIAVGAHLGLALNHVNRAMGLADIYPFVLTPEIRGKLGFALRWLRG